MAIVLRIEDENWISIGTRRALRQSDRRPRWILRPRQTQRRRVERGSVHSFSTWRATCMLVYVAGISRLADWQMKGGRVGAGQGLQSAMPLRLQLRVLCPLNASRMRAIDEDQRGSAPIPASPPTLPDCSPLPFPGLTSRTQMGKGGSIGGRVGGAESDLGKKERKKKDWAGCFPPSMRIDFRSTWDQFWISSMVPQLRRSQWPTDLCEVCMRSYHKYRMGSPWLSVPGGRLRMTGGMAVIQRPLRHSWLCFGGQR